MASLLYAPQIPLRLRDAHSSRFIARHAQHGHAALAIGKELVSAVKMLVLALFQRVERAWDTLLSLRADCQGLTPRCRSRVSSTYSARKAGVHVDTVGCVVWLAAVRRSRKSVGRERRLRRCYVGSCEVAVCFIDGERTLSSKYPYPTTHFG